MANGMLIARGFERTPLPDTPIYMDYQASTPLDPRVFAAMQPYFLNEYGNPHAHDHAFGWRADAAIENARERIGELIGADSDEIVFTSGATEANNLAIIGAARAAPPSRRRIVVSSIEHKCVLSASAALKAEGFDVVQMPVGAHGIIDPVAAAALVDSRTALVSVMAVNNEIGTVQPLAEIAAACHAVGALFHTDASQALAVLPTDVDEIGADLMSLSAHKAYGPKGIGALYIRRGVAIRPILHGGGQEQGLRSGTLPTPLCVGFGETCRTLQTERASEALGIAKLRNRFWNSLQNSIPSIVLNGAASPRHPGNLNVRLATTEATLLLNALQPHLAISTGAACTSGVPEPSHVLRAIGLTSFEADSSVRLSIGRFTTVSEIDAAVGLIADAVKSMPTLGGMAIGGAG